jgi:hypothetical protein
MAGFGDFSGFIRSQKNIRRGASQAQAAGLQSLQEQISADTSLDETSRAELLAKLTGQQESVRLNLQDISKSLISQSRIGSAQKGIEDISSTFAAARAGEDPVFRPRKLQKQQKSILQDMPGRAQTVLTMR